MRDDTVDTQPLAEALQIKAHPVPVGRVVKFNVDKDRLNSKAKAEADKSAGELLNRLLALYGS